MVPPEADLKNMRLIRRGGDSSAWHRIKRKIAQYFPKNILTIEVTKSITNFIIS